MPRRKVFELESRTTIVAIACAFAACALAVPAVVEGGEPGAKSARPERITTSWNTKWGDMELVQIGSIVAGSYTSDNGAVLGTMAGDTLDGFWIEDGANKKCATKKGGRFYWGKLVIVFDEELATFTSKWGYCEEQPTRTDWSGTRVGEVVREQLKRGSDGLFELYDNWNKRPCKRTKVARFTLDRAYPVKKLVIWSRWNEGEKKIAYTLSRDGETLHEGKFNRKKCDASDGRWCRGQSKVSLDLEPGQYQVQLAKKRICRNGKSGGNGLIKVRGGALPPAEPEKLSVAVGTWATSWGTLELTQSGKTVSGPYTTDNGKIVGKIEGNTLVGHWIEDAASQKCDTEKDGRFYWGRVLITFDETGDRWTGKWGYCEDEPTRTDWDGARAP